MALRPTPHDPLSEEMDLITWQEAEARLRDESVRVEADIQQLEGTGESRSAAEQSALEAARLRLAALHRVAERISSQRPSDDVDRYPKRAQD